MEQGSLGSRSSLGKRGDQRVSGGSSRLGWGPGDGGLWSWASRGVGGSCSYTCLVGGPSSRPGQHLLPHRIPQNSIARHRPRSTFHDVATALAVWETLALVCHAPGSHLQARAL